jgi:DNA-binding NtrC family response regulator
MTAARILVVDDEADIRGLLKEILSEEGYEVEVAADAAQARSARATQVPDLVLLDIWMPDTDGITLLREWSVTDGYDCPVVMMSGHGTVETAVEATRLGAFDFVEKPLSLTKLLRTVERALDAGRRKRLSERAQGSSLAVPIGKSKATQALREQIQNTASSTSPVLLVGELGSGREAYARYLHSLSARSAKPFFMVVSARLSGDSAAALFGSERDGKV